MNIALTLLGAILSAAGITLLAKKWNVAQLPNLAKAAFLVFVVAVPFLWIYTLFSSDWARLLCIFIQAAITLVIVLSIVFFRFWRDPERTPLENEGVIVSPADGEVIYVTQIPQGIIPLVTKDGQDYRLKELVGIDFDDQGKGIIVIGIEMNILNVHVNRCPIEGSVKFVRHIQGKFISLRKSEAPFLNTRCTTNISNKEVTVAIVQIASRLVRRVDNYLTPGQSVCLGQRLGMIRFGSQVAVIIPNRVDLRVDACIGQKTWAGISVLARY